jgi:outer membrane immunogenic protein
MKRLVLPAALLLALTAAAGAANLPMRPAPPVPYAAVPVFTWTGFYVGVNAGYGWNSNSNTVLTLQPA